ncbi:MULTISPECIES: hypothetical protein [unclassified Endozoicomonas]|uniref:hypothetical protein n=1 Tax=unclassified Endozoicomonas TaxID=2644528 RepID=UPI0021498020|nr:MULTISPECIES: hypothetical protein [unclassified Endozoicomonas]
MDTTVSKKSYLTKVVQLMSHYQSSSLSSEQRLNRSLALGYLQEYANAGVYASDDNQERTPIFKNGKGVYCALGYLLVKTGYKEFADEIANSNNYIDIEEIENFNSSDIGKWSFQYGIDRSEAVIIQRYSPRRGE